VGNEPSNNQGPSSTADKRAERPGASGRDKKGGVLSGGVGVVVVVLLLAAAAFLTWKTLTTAEMPTSDTPEAVFMCTEKNKTFKYAMKEGEQYPVVSPYTDKRTGYPTEPCFWTKVGDEWRRKETPTYVVMNKHLGKSGDTICPDCGHVVVGHNPQPPVNVPLVGAATPSSAPSAPAAGGG